MHIRLRAAVAATAIVCALLVIFVVAVSRQSSTPVMHVGAGGGPNSALLGTREVDKYVTHGEWATPVQCIGAATTVSIVPVASFTDASLASGESEYLSGLTQVTYNGDAGCTLGNCDAWFLRRFYCANRGGTCYSPNNASTDELLESQVGTTLAGTTDTISWDGTKLVQQVYCPVACCISTSGSYKRQLAVSNAPVIDSGPPVDSGTDSGTDAGTDSGTDAGDAGSPPVLTNVADTLFTSTTTTASTPLITLAGSNINTGCTVTVGGSAATSVTCSGTSVSFRPPTGLTESSTAYTVSVCNGAACASLNKGMYATAVCHGWHPAQGYSGGVATDYVAGVTATHTITGFTSPTTTTTFATSHTAWVFSGTQALSTAAAAITEAPTAGGASIVWRIPTGNPTYNFLFSGAVPGTPVASWNAYLSTGDGSGSIYAGATLSGSGWTQGTSPQFEEVVFNGASSSFFINVGATHTGAAGSQALADFTIGSRADGNAGLANSAIVGNIAWVAVRCAAPSAGQQTIDHTIGQQEWGTP